MPVALFVWCTLVLAWLAVVAWRWPSDALPPRLQARKAQMLNAWPSSFRSVVHASDLITRRRARLVLTAATGLLFFVACAELVVALRR